MRKYELTYLVSDEVLEKDLKTITDRVAGFVADEGGKVSKEEAWGRRKLTYPIKKQTFATYITLWFELPKDKITDIEHELRVHPQIIRHLIVAKIAKAEELVVTKEDIVGTEDVEKVLGEKSFEVVEGETEGSRDLMAVRETAEEDTEDQDDKKIEIAPIPEPTAEKAQPKTEKFVKPPLKADQPVVEKKKISKKVEKEKVIEESVVEAVTAEPEKEQEALKPEPKVEKPADEASTTQTKNTENDTEKSDATEESERIKKLDEKLDELLKDDL